MVNEVILYYDALSKKTSNYTYSCCIIHIALPPQQRLHQSASMLRYTYIACFLIYLWNRNLPYRASPPHLHILSAAKARINEDCKLMPVMFRLAQASAICGSCSIKFLLFVHVLYPYSSCPKLFLILVSTLITCQVGYIFRPQ